MNINALIKREYSKMIHLKIEHFKISILSIAGFFAFILIGCEDGSNNSDSSSSTPAIKPSVVGKLETSQGYYFKVVKGPGNYLFAAAGTAFQVIDVSNPSSPSIVASLTVPNGDWSSSLDYDGSNTVYIANGGMGLSSVDVTNPLNPTLLDTDNWDFGWTTRVKVSGNRAYLGKGNGGFRIYDISNRANISLISVVAAGANVGAQNLLLLGTDAILGFANSNKKFMFYDISNEASPAAGATYSGAEIADGVFEMAHYSNRLFVAGYSKGVKVFNVSDKMNPTLETTIAPVGHVVNLAIQGTVLYVLDDGIGLRTFDITNPSSPVAIDEVAFSVTNISATENYISGVTVDGQFAYVTSQNDGLYIIQWK